jgi:steroid delta-isomerase-like uncharacterized protein
VFNNLHLSRRTLSKTAAGALIGATTFRPARATFAQDATPAGSDSCLATTPEENEAIVQRYWDEVWNNHNDDALAEVFADDETHHWGLGDSTVGLEEFRTRLANFRNAFPDFQIHVEKTIKEGDHVVSYYRATGTHQGVWLGLEPTGTSFEYNGINIFRIACGKIAESWGIANHLSLLQQLDGFGAVATPTD